MSVRVDVQPRLLEWAVERAGWDRETTIDRVPSFSDWVAGVKKPTLKQLEKFARDTHAPIGLMFLPEPPEETVPIPDMRTFGNKQVPRPSVDLLDTIYSCQDRQDWYRTYAQTNDVEPPSLIPHVTTATPATVVARHMREKLGLPSLDQTSALSRQQMVRHLIDRIEGLGVLVMINGVVGTNTHRKLNPQEFRGFALADPLAPLIFVNGADTKAAQIFTLIHEFAHIILGSSALSDASTNLENGVHEEQWCNQVAAEVLVPLDALQHDFSGEESVAELERLSSTYQVSTLVILKRLFDAHLITWEEYRTRYATEQKRIGEILSSQKPSKAGGNFYNTQLIRLSRTFAIAVIASAMEGSTAYRQAYQLLGTKKRSTFDTMASELGIA
ncbi:ImmA/IrrE family metallo-endopeptidase [Brevibacterium sp. ACRRH]|uniref:ImmA/IrrE family metallo-endopeptidase n=1 Tax=Brevibacterium sp. ACRRH TaxID=2918183 RepID=UPI001EF56630|nr:ImmA/IrrE family metallo-endopeptidase [Brevibacterium sp. ACRRH]MCG7297961.1 ImmA/IrrE family metallo-endopeptidase [Brevibacterium sp. ACRRH]